MVCLLAVVPAISQEIRYQKLPEQLIEARLKRATSKNEDREKTLESLFEEAGCEGDHLSEQEVKGSKVPNVICDLPGETDATIIVSAHSDKVSAGQGVVDNWTGASLLPTLYQSLRKAARHLTFRFIGFTDEEKGLYGSIFYVQHLQPQDRAKILALVNIDSLGLSTTRVWVKRADKRLISDAVKVSRALNLPLARMDVDGVGDTDSHPFVDKKIPVIDFHSVTPETLGILHTFRDTITAVHMQEYYDSYCLLAVYLAYLDQDASWSR